VDPLDWKYRNSDRVERQILAGARPGAIILSHDIHATTVAAMPEVFDRLLAKGYKFVTVSELIAMDKPAPQVARKEPSASPTPAVTPGSSQKPLIPVFASKSPNSVASPPHPLDGIEKIHKTVIHVQLHVAVEKT